MKINEVIAEKDKDAKLELDIPISKKTEMFTSKTKQHI